MSGKHDDVFDDVLSGLPSKRTTAQRDKSKARFLKRESAISERISGEAEEKVLRWVDPADCRMWDRHNRDYALLHEENCRDLIDGIRSQGRQEFPAIVRRLGQDDTASYEVICGARRHFAVSWLRANNYLQFKYLIEVRDLTDEEAFRLADIENRDREDISDYERAVDYAQAIELYYDGKQKSMASRLEVSEVWLSRYLGMARLPQEIVAAFATKRDIRELHARTLKPLIAHPRDRIKVLDRAKVLAEQQQLAREGQGPFVDVGKVMATLKGTSPSKRAEAPRKGMVFKKVGKTCRLEFAQTMTETEFHKAIAEFSKTYFE